MTSDLDFPRLRLSTKPIGLTPTVNEVDFPTLEEVEAAKRKASENVTSSWATRSKGRLTDIGAYKTVHRHDNIIKYLANFHEKPAILLPKIQRNLKALLNIEMQRAALEYDFHKDLYQLKMKDQPIKQQISEEKTKIIVGEEEPGSIDADDRPPLDPKPRKMLTVDARIFADYLRGVKGVAHFWRCVFASTGFLSVLCSERDWKILDHLKDVRSTPLLGGGFKLEFHFGENDFMLDETLTKRFEGSPKIDQKRPYKFMGWSVDDITGCEIKWKEGMDPTLRKITKHRSDIGQQKTNEPEPKFVKTKSFFNFFAKPDQESTEISERILLGTESQTAIGNYLYHKVVPKAVLFVIGEANEKIDPPPEHPDPDDSWNPDVNKQRTKRVYAVPTDDHTVKRENDD